MRANWTGILALAGVAAVGYILWRNRESGTYGAGKALGGGVVDGINGATAGVVEGIGGIFGVPTTDASACRAAIASGNLWEASKMCPAADFISAAVSGAFIAPSTSGLPADDDGAEWATSGRWNNPSAYTAPSGQGGAAFGIYRRP